MNPKSTNINPTKRKFDKHVSDNKPHRKKRKFNEMNIIGQIGALFESNESLKEENSKLRKERDHYKLGRSLYRNEANKWKSKYNKLYSQHQGNKLTLSAISPVLPPSKYTHKRTIPNGKRHNVNKSVETQQFVFKFNQLINNDAKQKNDNQKLTEKKNKNDSTVDLENSYHISVNCHICKELFDNIYKYGLHLEQHYNNDAKRTWKQCEFGCNRKKESGTTKFIQHIATHTKDKAYKCNKCEYATAYSDHIKRHCQSQHIHTDNKPLTIMKNRNKTTQNSKAKPIPEPVTVDFEDSYYVAINCHICRQHFDDLYEYKEHLKQEYNNHPTKTWCKCDFECANIVFKDVQNFICHIAAHTKDKPYKCNINKCRFSAGTKGNQRQHFNTIHNKKKQTCKKAQNDYNSSDSDSSSETDYDSSSSSASQSDDIDGTLAIKCVDFEKSYIVSVHCHVCNMHFDDFDRYRHHIRAHYVSHPNKKWTLCDFGCKDKQNNGKQYVAFVFHIAHHTKDYPFKCNVGQCTAASASKGNLKRHWNNIHNENRYNKIDGYGSTISDDESSSSSQSESEDTDSRKVRKRM